MSKIFLKSLLLIGGIVAAVLIIGQINFQSATEGADELIDLQEEKLGDALLKVFNAENRSVTDSGKLAPIIKITEKICEANELDCEGLKVHLLDKRMVNAFALPGGNVVLFTELIAVCENAEELAGVIAHEIAHVKMDHIRRKLMREVGISIAVGIAGGSAGGEAARQVASILASSSYGRQLENEADEQAVIYLSNAGINPNGLAELLNRIADNDEELPAGAYWFSSHPNPNERVRSIREKAWSLEETEFKPLYSKEEWEQYLDKL